MEPLRIYLGDENLTPLFISPDSQRLFARPWIGRTLKVFSLLAAEPPEVIEDRDHQIEDAAIRARERSGGPEGGDGGQDLLVLLEGGLVKRVDLQTYETVDADFLRVGEHAQRLVCSSDGIRMAVGYHFPKIGVNIGVFNFDTKQWQELQELKIPWDGPDRMRFSPDGRYLIAVGDNLLAVWDDKGKLVKEVDTEGPNGSRLLWTDVAVTPDSTKLIWLQNSGIGGATFAECDYHVLVHDLGSVLRPFRGERGEDVKEWEFDEYNAAPRAVDISHDGRRVIVGGRLAEFTPAVVCEWSLDAPGGCIGRHMSFAKIAEFQGLVLFARMAPDGSKIVVVTEEKIPPSGEQPKSHLFISVCDYPKRHLLQ
jgi:hypothetical protein